MSIIRFSADRFYKNISTASYNRKFAVWVSTANVLRTASNCFNKYILQYLLKKHLLIDLSDYCLCGFQNLCLLKEWNDLDIILPPLGLKVSSLT